jgi:hypothetical protein
MESDDRSLRGAIGRHVLYVSKTPPTDEIVHDVTLRVLSLNTGRKTLNPIDHAPEVHINCPSPFVSCQRVHGVPCDNAGAVDEEVDNPECLKRG